MTEMHLDLCIQSTNHLLETVASIKENIRILEVFLNSGLTNVELNGQVFGANSGYNSSSESRGSNLLLKGYYQQHQPLSDNLTSSSAFPLSTKNHLNCCCMCHFRLSGATRDNLKRPESRASVTTMSMSSNTTQAKRKFSSGPRLIPRLNKTASLRRETVLQKVGKTKNTFY